MTVKEGTRLGSGHISKIPYQDSHYCNKPNFYTETGIFVEGLEWTCDCGMTWRVIYDERITNNKGEKGEWVWHLVGGDGKTTPERSKP